MGEKMKSRSLPLLAATLVLGTPAALAAVPAATLIGPTPYLQAADSPFATLGSALAIEDFEDGLLNLSGVATTSPGLVVGAGGFTDSVDGDDGNVDGNGTAGHSLLAGSNVLAFSFDPIVIGRLPTHVGIVWTDVGTASGSSGNGLGDVLFEAFDAGGGSLGIVGPALLGNGSANGDSANATAEDRFFGVIYAGGIARVEIRMPDSADWEVDHLQYAAVPVPGALALLGAPLAWLARRRRR
ncbi:MAG: hypothetical protein AB7Q97_24755 [Gammaproteobacteria bacterium]